MLSWSCKSWWIVLLVNVLVQQTSTGEVLDIGQLQTMVLSSSLSWGREFNTTVSSIEDRLCQTPVCCNASSYDPQTTDFLETVAERLGGCCEACSCADQSSASDDYYVDVMQDTSFAERNAANVTECVSPQIWSYISSDKDQSPTIAPVSMVTSCQGGTVATRQKCNRPDPRKVFETLPVTSKVTGITYWNQDCAVCNGENSTERWEASVHIPMYMYGYRSCESSFSDYKKFLDFLIRTGPSAGSVTYRAPSSMTSLVQRKICAGKEPVLDACNATGLWQNYDSLIERACLSHRRYYEMDGRVYGNFFCFLCNVDKLSMSVEPVLKVCNISLVPRVPEGSVSGRLNMQAVGDNAVNPRSDFTLFSSRPWDGQTPACGCIWDPNKKVCRPMFCPRGDVPKNCECKPMLQQMSGMRLGLNIRVTFVPAFGQGDTDDSTWSEAVISSICVDVSYHMHSLLSHQVLLLGEDSLVKNTTRVLYAVCRVRVGVWPGVDYRDILKTLRKESGRFSYHFNKDGRIFFSRPDFGLVVEHGADDTLEVYDSADGSPLTALQEDDKRTKLHFQDTSKLHYCTQVELNASEFVELNTGRIYVNVSQKIITVDYYSVKERIRVCIEDYFTRPSTEPKQAKKLILPQPGFAAILSFVCMMISLLALLYTLGTYAMFKALRNTPGLCNIGLSLHMFCAQLLFLFGIDQTTVPEMCVGLGMSIHFFWLSTILWMQVCCFHMYRTFVGDLRDKVVQIGGNIRIVLLYGCYCWLVSAILVGATSLVSELHHGVPGYGKSICYISDPPMIGWFFALPVGIVVMVNVIMFVSVAFVIYRQQASSASLVSSRNSMLIYVKLSTITGMSWAFGFIYIWTQLIIFEILFIVFSGGQGFFIASSFVMSANVRNLWKNQLGLRIKKEQSSTLQTPQEQASSSL